MHAVEQTKESGLAATRWSDKTCHCVFREVQGNIGQCVVLIEPSMHSDSFKTTTTRHFEILGITLRAIVNTARIERG